MVCDHDGIAMPKMEVVTEAPDQNVALVEEIRALKAAGNLRRARERAGELLERVRPEIKRAARRYAKIAGSLSLGDLEQIASIEALKAIDRYSRGCSSDFPTFVYLRAKTKCREHAGLHGSDVHASNCAQRGKTKRAGNVKMRVLSADDYQAPRELARALEEALRIDRPKSDLEAAVVAREDEARVFDAVRRLPHQQRELVCRRFGLNRPEQSIRGVAAEWGVSHVRLVRMLGKTLGDLRGTLTEPTAS